MFALNVRDPVVTLEEVSESAFREIIGKNETAYIMGTGGQDIARQAFELAQNTLNDYESGMEIVTFNLKRAIPPAPVQPAVIDATKAREDKSRTEELAQAYRNEIIPRARGDAAKQIQNAEAYKAEVIANAEGEAARFVALLTEYQAAPEVTRTRLYLQTLEEVYGQVGKVLLDVQGSGNLLYLPVDKLLEQQRNQSQQLTFSRTNTVSPEQENDRETDSSRRTRR